MTPPPRTFCRGLEKETAGKREFQMKCYTCRRVVIRTVLATAVAFVVQLEPSQAQISATDRDDVLRSSEHVVYTETNDVTNAILAFRRDDTGLLTLLSGAPFRLAVRASSIRPSSSDR